jgi:predicted DNA-binding ribbon-helix-helix protein
MQTIQTLQKLYEQDFVAWCEATVTQLKAGQLDQLDVENLIEEIDSLGKRDRRELTSRLRVLLAHLLKRLYLDMPENFNGWELTIVEQRKQIQALLKDSPSLKPYLAAILPEVYLDSLELVSIEYKQVSLPNDCPFCTEVGELLSKQYWLNSEK